MLSLKLVSTRITITITYLQGIVLLANDKHTCQTNLIQWTGSKTQYVRWLISFFTLVIFCNDLETELSVCSK